MTTHRALVSLTASLLSLAVGVYALWKDPPPNPKEHPMTDRAER